MSEIKGQLLCIILVIAVFGAITAILVPSFTSMANEISTKITTDDKGKTTVEPYVPKV